MLSLSNNTSITFAARMASNCPAKPDAPEPKKVKLRYAEAYAEDTERIQIQPDKTPGGLRKKYPALLRLQAMPLNRITGWILTRMGAMSLRVYLVVGFFTCALLPLALLTGLQLKQIASVGHQTDRHQEQMTDTLARDVAAYVGTHRHALEAAAHQLTVSGDLQPQHLTSILSGLHAALPGFINLYVANEHAVTLAFEPPFNAAGQSMVGVDFSYRWHYRAVRERKTTVMSPVMKGRGGTEKLLITIVVPYFDVQGNFAGFVLGALNLGRLGTLLEGRGPFAESYAAITDAGGLAIWHPRFDDETTPRDLSADTLVKQARLHPKGTLEHWSPLSGQQVFSTWTHLASPDWVLWISTPTTQRNAAREEALLSASLLLAATLLGTGILVWVLVLRTNGAVSSLLDQMQRLQRGHPKLPPTHPAIPKPREFTLLEQGLDAMAAELVAHQQALQESNVQLEERVRNRTQRLEERQQEIETLYRETAAQRSVLQAVLESMSDAVVLVDGDARLIHANRNFGRLICPEAEPAITPHPGTAFDAVVAAAPPGLLPELQRLGQALSGQESQLMMAYAGRHYLAILFDVNTPDGERIGHGGLIRDVTHEYEIEQMKDSLISVAAHEFKTPVTALRMRVESLLREDAHWSEEFRQELLSGMRDDVGALQTLISDWLDIARIESGSLRLSIEEVAIEEVIQSAVDAARIYGVFDLTLQIGPELTAPVDEQRLRQVLINLLSNAIRYCDRTPDIVIEATRSAMDELTISVRDNGIGIAATDLEQVFERYYQVQRGNVRRPGGTGLGLAIAKGIMTAHGGRIEVSSEPGCGSVFRLVIPCRKESG